jgi:hypothetical protein
LYLKYHILKEQKEYDFRINFFKKKNKKQKSESKSKSKSNCKSKTTLENNSINGSIVMDSFKRINHNYNFNCSFFEEEGLLLK